MAKARLQGQHFFSWADIGGQEQSISAAAAGLMFNQPVHPSDFIIKLIGVSGIAVG